MKRTLLFLLLLTFLFIAFMSQIYRVWPKAEPPEYVISALNALAIKALEMREVPIGAVLVYGDSIIGKGYNTVVRDTLVSGHAEINALNMAHKNHRASWKSFDRSKMILYSTYEPCEMCKGAMINLNIEYAVFEGPKPVWDRLKTTLKSWYYEFKKRRLNAPEMQQNLFRQHPDYQE
ncbi:MAG: nucleoside deaminase [Saprospiraceae bacterium]